MLTIITLANYIDDLDSTFIKVFKTDLRTNIRHFCLYEGNYNRYINKNTKGDFYCKNYVIKSLSFNAYKLNKYIIIYI